MSANFLNIGNFSSILSLIMLLVVCSTKSHTSFENETLLMNPDVHLRMLFSKYGKNESICAHGLDKLISDVRHPKKQVG